ncbi:MAG: thymidylate synthase, partial [Armatimonadetes bacterium]|nr:thymidylate synthase [Armatimonadota bacterium]
MSLSLPVVQITAQTLPEAWEKAVLQTWELGARISTQYDKPSDPPSRDAICVIVVTDPMSEPRIHRAFPGGIVELEAYRQEVVEGIHDHWVNPAEGKWEYTYHERLAAYSVPGLPKPIDQIEYAINALAEAPHTRRAQAITWKPWEDAGIHDPACLQRLWFRVFGDELVMNVHMRSNDAFKAAFMNMYAFTDLQRLVADELSA